MIPSYLHIQLLKDWMKFLVERVHSSNILVNTRMKSIKHWILSSDLYNEIDRRMNMKEAILKLENNKTISTKDIKCPVCGGLMEIDHSEVNSYDCSSSISLEHMPSPFEGTMVKHRNDYTTRFKCPNGCCHLEMKHYIENILFWLRLRLKKHRIFSILFGIVIFLLYICIKK